MKMNTILKHSVFTLLLLAILIAQTHPQQPTPNTTDPQQPKNQTVPDPLKNQTIPKPSQNDKPLGYFQIQLDRPYKQQLTSSTSFSQKYRVKINLNKVEELKDEKWFFFVEVSTAEEFEWEKTKIELFSINQAGNQKPLKQCETTSGLDSCFLTNKNFDYKTQTIQAKVTCQEKCQFTISAEISTKYELPLDKPLELDFENTAYSTLFRVDTDSMFDFKRLQIILKPKGFLSFDAPIRLYANKGDTIPTKQKHDYAGIHLWDDGLGIFISYPEGSGIFTVLVEGPQQNVLVIEANVIFGQKPIKTTKYEPAFAYLQGQEKQLFEIKIDKTQYTMIKLTTLTGSIEMGEIYDESMNVMKTDFTPESRSYGEYEYKFGPSFFENNKDANISDKVIVEVKAFKDSTFVFESYTSGDEMNFLLAEVNRYVDMEKNGVDIYYLRLYEFKENINENNKNARIDLMTATYDYVNLNTKIFLCKSNIVKECQPNNEEIEKLRKSQSIDTVLRKELKNATKDTSVPGVEYHDIIINYNDFLITESYYSLYVIVVIINPQVDQQIVYTLQYIDTGSTYFLKEKQLKKDRLAIDQVKYYTFVNNDKDVKEIRIHAVQISGEILMVGYKLDPRLQNLEGKQVYEYHGSVAFLDVKPAEQFFLKVQGIDNAYFSLYLQLIRESEKVPDEKGGNQGYNEIVIQMDTPYDFYIKPKQKIIVQMRVTETVFNLVIGAHLPLQLCMTENLDKPPFNPNCDIKETISKNEIQKITMDKGLIGNIGITNNNDRAVEFKIEMLTTNKSKTAICKQSCPGMMNKFNFEIPITPENSTSNSTDPANATKTTNTTKPVETAVQCYKINLRRRENLEIMVELDNMLYDNTTITWQLGNKEKEIMIDSRRIVWKKQLVKVCGQSQKDLCELIVTIESNYSTGGILLVQYLDKDMILLDGIAQPVFMKRMTEEPKRFRYEMINLVNTTIIFENTMGQYRFYGDVISRIDFMKEANRTLLFPTTENYLFASENPFYYGFQFFILTEETLKNQTCKSDCVLLISVYPGAQKGVLVDQKQMDFFFVEVSQEDRYLKDNQPIIGYLERGSIVFYEFYNPQKGTLIIQLNNQNMKCANIFVKKGNNTRALPSAYDKMADQNQLILENAEKGPYSIAVESKGYFGCSYTIQAMSSVAKLQKIKRGVFSDNTLDTNETFHFLYENYRNESFKVMTLNKMGEVMIKVKVLYEGDLNKLISSYGTELNKQLSNLSYQESGVDFVKVNSDALYFCVDCTFLISLTANKKTVASIIIPSNDVDIPIATNALIKDQIQAKEIMKYRIFTSNIAKYQIHVQYGQINMTLVQKVSQKVFFSKIYNQTKEPIIQSFNSTPTDPNTSLSYIYDFFHYNALTIEGVGSSSFYSFELFTEEDEDKIGNIKLGLPEYVYLETNKTKCLKGIIDDDSEVFILSFPDAQIQTVRALVINVKVNDQKVVYQTSLTSNQMSLEIKDLKLKEPASYEFCMNSPNETIEVTFIQSAHIILVPSNTAVLLTRPTNVTFKSTGETVMEIDECGSRSIISVSSAFNDLHTSESEIKQIRRANNLIEFFYYGPVFVHFETQGTRIRWRDKDFYDELGMGYENFMPGTASAFKEGESIKIEIKPIEKAGSYKKQTNFTVTSIKYKVILGRYDKEILGALNCQNGESNLTFEHEAESLDSSAVAVFPIVTFSHI